MMKSLVIGMLMVSTMVITVSAQTVGTEYFNEAMEPASSTSYTYKREVSKTDSGYVYMDFQKNGKLKFRGEYASIHPDVPHGHFQFYQQNGKPEAEGYYVHGDMVGTWVFYDKKGSAFKKVDYDLSGKTCESSDTAIHYRPMQTPEETGLHQIPVFPGGDEAFYAFIFSQIVYPPLAKMYYKSGRAIGMFTINESGIVCDATAGGDVDPDIKRETIRVLNLLPKWEPGKIGNRPVSVRYTCPIKFKFE